MIVCFDIGGTAIKGAVAYSADDIRPFPRQPTPIDDFDAFVAVLQSVIDQSGGRPDCVALSIAGVIDPDTRRAVVANVPCIHGRMLQQDLEAALGLPVLVANDADCFVLAEAGIGAGRGHRVVFGVILGTGVGGGLVIDGHLINAEGGFAVNGVMALWWQRKRAIRPCICPVSPAVAGRSAASMPFAARAAWRSCTTTCMARR